MCDLIRDVMCAMFEAARR